MKVETNKAEVIGRLVDDFHYSHSWKGEDYYESTMYVLRQSLTEDIIRVVGTEEVISGYVRGDFVYVYGSYRSYNTKPERKLMHFLLANDMRATSPSTMNEIKLRGYVCKEPIYRITPKGRKICDLMLAVNRYNGKADYIPCVLWGRNASDYSSLEIGDCVSITGRIQSRTYSKRIGTAEIINVINEISVESIL